LKEVINLIYIIHIPKQENLDLTGVRKMITRFEKAISKNQELRVKFPDDPTK
jgi:beta-catenin-like protein 1